jgi:hypothetical protein
MTFKALARHWLALYCVDTVFACCVGSGRLNCNFYTATSGITLVVQKVLNDSTATRCVFVDLQGAFQRELQHRP